MKRKRLYLLLLGLLLAFSIYLGIVQNRISNEMQIQFLNTYGSINYQINQLNTISLGFITKGNNTTFGDILSLAFDSSEISAENVSVKKSITAGEYTLWFLNFQIVIESEKSNVIIEGINFNGKPYSIGRLDFIMSDKTEYDHFEIKECVAASFGKGLKNYYVSMKNATTNDIFLNSVEVPYYSDVTTTYQVNEQESILDKNSIIGIDETVTITLLLEEYNPQKADVYYVSPILHYEYKNRLYEMPLNYYTSGLNIEKNDLLDLGVNLFN